jgi:Ca-activated chloride channel family protein
MAFLQPFAFLLLGLIPVVIAMYLLKLRRTEQQVSSVYLWQRMVRDVEANAPWQRLRRNLLLLLQLLFLLALIVALARPFRWAAGSGSQSTILIVDTSASMAATDAVPNRLEAAKAQARRVVDDLPDDAQVTVIAAGETAQVLLASSQDRRQAYLAIDSLQQTAGGSNLTDALELASAISARQPDTEIVVLSDGNVDLPDRLAVEGHLRYLPVGTEGDNQAISLLTVEQSPGTQELSAFAQVSNYTPEGSQPAQRRISFYVDGQLFQAFDLEIEAGSQQAVLAAGLPETAKVVEARLSGADMLALDDQARVVYRPVEPVQVTLVSAGNRFLETALNLLPGVELTTIRPADWESAADLSPAGQTTSLTVFDTYVPLTRTLPASSLLFIGPVGSTDLFTVTGSVEAPQLSAAVEDDPLLANLSGLDQVHILDASQISLPEWGKSILESDQRAEPAPMLVRGEPQGQRVAILAFDLRRSDLPLQVVFPVLLANLRNWLAPPASDLPAQVNPGEALSFTLPQASGAIQLERPDGTRLPLEVQGGRALLPEASQLGIYTVQWGEGEQARFVVNLFSPQESKISPAGQLQVIGLADAGDPVGQQQARREWWRPLVWLALLVMLLEWLVYQRANLRHIWDRLRERWLPGEQAGSGPTARRTYR